MPQANDAELTRLFTASQTTGHPVEDNEPNTPEPAGVPATDFLLILEAVAGNVKGDDGSDYTLYLDAVAETNAAPPLVDFVEHQEFKQVAPGEWIPDTSAGNFVKEQKFTITVPPNAKGHVYHYVGRLVSRNRDLVSFIQSNSFILV